MKNLLLKRIKDEKGARLNLRRQSKMKIRGKEFTVVGVNDKFF